METGYSSVSFSLSGYESVKKETLPLQMVQRQIPMDLLSYRSKNNQSYGCDFRMQHLYQPDRYSFSNFECAHRQQTTSKLSSLAT